MKIENVKFLSEAEKKAINSNINSSVELSLLQSFLEGATVRPVYYSGSGRNTKINDFKDGLLFLVNKLGYKYTEGNDAPRGGKAGYFIKINRVPKFHADRVKAINTAREEAQAAAKAHRDAYWNEVAEVVNKITVDEQFIAEITEAKANLTGPAKSEAQNAALTALLLRCNVVVTVDFWDVWRAVKAKASM